MAILFTNKRLNNSGQALVEFAIILPFLLILVFAITEFGRYLYIKNSVTQAAREGARKAAVTSPWDGTSELAVKTYVIQSSSLSLAPNNISITPTPPTTGTAVIVTVRKQFSSAVPNLLPIFQNKTSISAFAAMRYE